jgi:hypothetical protein
MLVKQMLADSCVAVSTEKRGSKPTCGEAPRNLRRSSHLGKMPLWRIYSSAKEVTISSRKRRIEAWRQGGSTWKDFDK